ncbi:BON domain-containing protein [Legionella quateirensis]|uniref:Phospholipid binding protein n=1 Tax=Legionella quateirensis TaxID=45072 RepID=A0A378KU85_9GAMM|nr:phospholipid binding protein [Legionella quateirensis]STY17057.1 phospholipid binding protein [Legionella quateirensis]
MQKYLVNGVLAGLFLLLTGCMNNTGSSTMFSPYQSSMTLAQSVQDALMRNPDPLIAQVHVVTNQNTVILSGYVKKIRQSDTAEQIARQVPGVQTVENNIIVRQ